MAETLISEVLFKDVAVCRRLLRTLYNPLPQINVGSLSFVTHRYGRKPLSVPPCVVPSTQCRVLRPMEAGLGRTVRGRVLIRAWEVDQCPMLGDSDETVRASDVSPCYLSGTVESGRSVG